MNTTYGIGANKTLSNTTFAATYDKLNYSATIANTSFNTLSSNESTITPMADFTAVIKGAWGIIKMSFGAIDTVSTMTTDVSNTFLPKEQFGWLPIAIVAIITIILAFTVISAVFRQPL
jgi:hypothetical protein